MFSKCLEILPLTVSIKAENLFSVMGEDGFSRFVMSSEKGLAERPSGLEDIGLGQTMGLKVRHS